MGRVAFSRVALVVAFALLVVGTAALGRALATWGGGPSYDRPGGVWVNRQP